MSNTTTAAHRKPKRFLGTISDGRLVAEALSRGEVPPRPKRSGRSLREISKICVDGLALQAIFKLEKLLKADDIDEKQVKAASIVLEAARSHADWIQNQYPKSPKNGDAAQRPGEEEPSGDFSNLDDVLEDPEDGR